MIRTVSFCDPLNNYNKDKKKKNIPLRWVELNILNYKKKKKKNDFTLLPLFFFLESLPPLLLFIFSFLFADVVGWGR